MTATSSAFKKFILIFWTQIFVSTWQVSFWCQIKKLRQHIRSCGWANFEWETFLVVTEGSYISVIPGGGIGVGDLSSLLTFKLKKGVAIDIDHRITKQQYTPLLPFNGIEGGRKTSCMACQQKKIAKVGCAY